MCNRHKYCIIQMCSTIEGDKNEMKKLKCRYWLAYWLAKFKCLFWKTHCSARNEYVHMYKQCAPKVKWYFIRFCSNKQTFVLII